MGLYVIPQVTKEAQFISTGSYRLKSKGTNASMLNNLIETPEER